MAMSHLKTLVAPTTWPIQRKEHTFVTRPHPGGHPLDLNVSLQLVITKMLNMARTAKEVQQILNRGKVLVDGRVRKDRKTPVGLFDTLSFQEIKQQFRLVLGKDGILTAVQINEQEACKKLSKIIGKTIISNKQNQINLSDGRNILTKGNWKVGDSLVVAVPNQEVKDHLPLEEGATVLLTRGKRRGTIATIEKCESNLIFYKTKAGINRTTRSHLIVVGKEKPAITIEGQNE